MKLTLCVIFYLCCFAALAFGSIGSESNQSETTVEKPLENLEGLFGYFKTLEHRIRELEKSQVELKEQVKVLEKQVDETKNGTRRDDENDVLLLTPSLRGPPKKQREERDSGVISSNETSADKRTTNKSQVSTSPAPKGEKRNEENSALELSISSCSAAMEILPSSRSAKQWIYPHGNARFTKVKVLCDFEVDGGGWTVIQKRSSGPREEFNRTWNEYAKGFGSLDGNFWIGLENIRALTKNRDQELTIELEDFKGEKRFAKYSNFSISDASDFYRLSISGFSGDSTAGDSMTDSHYSANNGMRFSTRDKDNDLRSRFSCVEHFSGGGWWFNVCSASHLNGPYRQKGEDASDWKGINWYSWKEWESLAKAEMKIRTRK